MKTSNLGKMLKELRETTGNSQKDIAKDLGVSVTCYAGYEQNYRDPDLDMLKKIAIYYNVSTDYLLGLEDETGAKYVNSFNNTVVNASENSTIKF